MNDFDYIIATPPLNGALPEGRLLFLGSWCETTLSSSPNSKSVTLPYHWDRRSQIPENLAYIQQVYEVVLEKLAERLNSEHGCDHGTEYWRLVVGWWLLYFIQVLYDRWMILREAELKAPSAPLWSDVSRDPRPAKTSDEFVRLTTTDEWNARFWFKLASEWRGMETETVGTEALLSERFKAPKGRRRVKERVWRNVGSILNRLLLVVPSRGGGISLVHDYLPMRKSLELSLSLCQIPRFPSWFDFPEAKDLWTTRDQPLGGTATDGFVSVVMGLVMQMIPQSYLEGYSLCVGQGRAFGWRTNPRKLVTANSFCTDDVWKVWAAGCRESGSVIEILQHGGGYGSMRWMATLEYERSVADAYYTWGWSRGGDPILTRAPATRLVRCGKVRSDSAGKCLIISTSLPRYATHLTSQPVAGQYRSFLEHSFRVVREFKVVRRQEVHVRPGVPDHGWNLADRWRSQLPGVTIQENSHSLWRSLSQSRLAIVVYNGTPLCELLARRFPTVVTWDPDLFELADEARGIFDRMSKVGIFFSDPKQCARHVDSIWSEPQDWWEDSEVQSVVNDFVEQYARIGTSPMRELRSKLLGETWHDLGRFD